MARRFLRLDRSGHLDRAAEQQQLLGQRRFTGVRVRNDREGAAFSISVVSSVMSVMVAKSAPF
jgi:hypothetical protein